MNRTEKIALIGVVIGFMAWQFPVSETGLVGNKTSVGAVTIYTNGTGNHITSSNINMNNQNVIATNGSVAILNSDVRNSKNLPATMDSEKLTKKLWTVTDEKLEDLQTKLDDLEQDLASDLNEVLESNNQNEIIINKSQSKEDNNKPLVKSLSFESFYRQMKAISMDSNKVDFISNTKHLLKNGIKFVQLNTLLEDISMDSNKIEVVKILNGITSSPSESELDDYLALFSMDSNKQEALSLIY